VTRSKSPLENILFSARTGLTPAAIKTWWPQATKWTERDHSLLVQHTAIAPFRQLEYMLQGGMLYNVKLVAVRVCDYAGFAALEQEMYAQFPSITEWTDTLGRPFSLADSRKILEGKGDARFMMATPIGGELGTADILQGKALAFRRDDKQHYGFELFWRQGGYPS
jgi:hypothetical protein